MHKKSGNPIWRKNIKKMWQSLDWDTGLLLRYLIKNNSIYRLVFFHITDNDDVFNEEIEMI